MLKSTFPGALVAVALGLSTLVLAGDVNVDWDRDADFSKYKSFAIKIGTSWGNPLSEDRVLKEFRETIMEKGWSLGPEGEADTVVVLHGATRTKKNLNTFYDGWGGGWGFGGWGMGGMGSAQTRVTEYLVGTLVVDIFDAKTKKLLFRGNATDELSDKVDKNMKKVDKAASKMFKDFPPKPKKTD